MLRKTTYAYGTNTTTVTDPKLNVTVETYRNNKLVSVTKGNGTPQQATWQYSYDPVTLGVATEADPDGHSTSKTYDAAGNVLTQTDGLGRTTTNTYDALNDLLTAKDPLNVTTTNTYSASGNLLTSSRPLTGTSQNAVTANTYGDTAHPGDVTAMTDADGKTSHYVYDQYGDKTQITDPLNDLQTTQYNTIGWVTSSVSPLGNVSGGIPANYTTTYARNAFGDVTTTTDPLGHTTVKQYDGDRNVISVKDPDQNLTQSSYNKDNELTLTTRADTSTLSYGYDADGNRTTVTDGLNHTTSYAFDPLNRLSSATDPLNRKTTYGYDGAGNRTSMVDPQSQTTTTVYDAANQVTSITYSSGTTPNVSNITYDGDGGRTAFTDGTGTSSFVYDSLRRLTQSTTGAGQTVGYGYDLKGQLTSLQYPGGSTVTRGYDDAGRLTSVQDWLTHTTTFGYDADSNLTKENYPNSTVTTTGYDRTDRVISISDVLGSTTFLSFGYTRDNAGQLASLQPTGVTQGNETYGYNPLNQLTSVNQPTYAYDHGDNITTLGSATAIYDAANEATSLSQGGLTTTFTYDSRGNRTQMAPQGSASTAYGYDQANRLVSYGASATYGYNGDGLRMSKTVSGTTTQSTWDVAGSLPLQIVDGTTKYVYGPGGRPVEQVDGSGTALYFHQDQLGSTRALTNASGAVVATYTFDAYGSTTASTGSSSAPLLYAGQYRDAESGFYYLRARYYDPATAQFLSRDPLTPLTKAPYSYAYDNPLNGSDPSGLDPQWFRSCVQAGACNADATRAPTTETSAYRSQWVQQHASDLCSARDYYTRMVEAARERALQAALQRAAAEAASTSDSGFSLGGFLGGAWHAVETTAVGVVAVGAGVALGAAAIGTGGAALVLLPTALAAVGAGGYITYNGIEDLGNL